MDDSSTRARSFLAAADERWQRHRAALDDAFAEAIDGLQALVDADDYHQHAHEPNELERALGPLGANNLDLGSLSRVLSGGTHSRAMQPERFARVQGLIPRLQEMRGEVPRTLADSTVVDLQRDSDEIAQLAEDHLNRAARVFRTLRTAQMEVRSKYVAEIHDAFFEDFTWRELGPNELRSCPPFIVVADLDETRGTTLLKMMSLLGTGMPIKILALRSSLREVHSAVAEARVPTTLAVEMLPLALRGVHFVQTSAAVPDFQSQFFEAIVAPRPSVLSVLCARPGEEPDAFERRAEGAIRSRAFPVCTYDPDRATRFVDCFDVASNPAPDATWVRPLAPAEQPELDEAFTFAHFAAQDPEFEQDVSDPPEDGNNLVPIVEYLALTRHQRDGKLPFVSCIDEEGAVVRKVVSQEVALQSAERQHLWSTLREIAGVDNPHVAAARAEVKKELTAQQDETVQKLRQDMEERGAQREKVAVETALRNLVTRLTGTPD